MDRRSALKTIGILAGSMTTLLFPGSHEVAAALLERRATAVTAAAAGRPDPTFAQGRVIARMPGGMIVQSAAGQRAVHVGPETGFWKERAVGYDNIEYGDWLDVSGEALADGSLRARQAWANITRFDGVVEAVGADGVQLAGLRSGRAVFIRFSDQLEVINRSDFSARLGGPSSLIPGQRVGLVGVTLRSGEIRATRIWVE